MRITLDVVGVEKVISNFKRFGREGKRAVAEITQIQALEIEAQAKRDVKVVTGKLQQSIKAERFKPLTWLITAFESYASFIEFGTSRSSAQPFLRPAWKRAIKIYRKDLNNAFVRLAKKYSK